MGVYAGFEIPEKIFGVWALERSENFDEFLAAKGVNWFLRQLIKSCGLTKVIVPNVIKGTYNMENRTGGKNTDYQQWKLGEEFVAHGMDQRWHHITFTVENDTLLEHHVRLPERAEETYYYTVDENNKLVMKMENNGIVCRRWFNKVSERPP